MRKFISSTYITIDGAVESPHMWPKIGQRGAEGDEIQNALLQSSDALLMGRRTYDVFAAVWPTRTGDQFSDRINSMPKYVVSSSLTNPTWKNTSVINSDVPGAIKRLKDQPGQDIVQYGLGQVSWLLIANGLLDEVRLWLHPLILGQIAPGQPHFKDCPPCHLRLTNSRTLENGVAILTYDVEAIK